MGFRQLGCSQAKILACFIRILLIHLASRSGVLVEAPCHRPLAQTLTARPQPFRSCVVLVSGAGSDLPPQKTASHSPPGQAGSRRARRRLRPAMQFESLSIPRAPARTDDQYLPARITYDIPKPASLCLGGTARLGRSRLLSCSWGCPVDYQCRIRTHNDCFFEPCYRRFSPASDSP
ncbi:hypothetical protein K466DRAFT_138199 [Polyporus arcularius HHB13444]|uniref:Secreted protein n=1 Tax=Polyporus arcularius HHB13444 TaxID=1314778 RepID=A0A5C3PU24_9APHY|nr:hypothetical protein K466DRAFT_138199 [Polyporus arcularius HHB13444]